MGSAYFPVFALVLAGGMLPLLPGGVAKPQFAAVFAPGTDMTQALARVASSRRWRLVRIGAVWPAPVLVLAAEGTPPAPAGALLLPIGLSAGCAAPPGSHSFREP